MKKIIVLLILGISSSLLATEYKVMTSEQMAKFEQSAVVRLYFDDKEQINKAAQYFAFWQVDHKLKFAIVDVKNQYELKKLIGFGFEVAIDQELTQKYHSEQIKNKEISGSGIPGYACYSTVEETFSRMDLIATNNPGLAEIIDIGDSWEKTVNVNMGYDMRVLKITNQLTIADKPKVFIMSAVHAREYTTAELTTRFAEYLMDQYNQNADVKWMVDHHELHLLLHSNPDGRKQAETGLFWRKNVNESYCSPGSSSRGADLNRNFPFEWFGPGSSENECSDVYRGPNAVSEPEISSIVNYVRTLYSDERDDDLNDPAPLDKSGVFIDVHSYSELVLWPWGISLNDSPNERQFQAFGRSLAFFNGYEPKASHELYPTNGTSLDMPYGELGVASFVFELGTQFFQDCNVFEQTVLPDNINSLMYALRVARAPYKSPSGPNVNNIQLSTQSLKIGATLTITATASDLDFNQTNGTEPTHNISKVNLYLDQLPWALGSSGTIMLAVDGNFDSKSELVTAQLDTTGLSVGEHMVYMVGEDVNAEIGPVFATKFSVLPLNDLIFENTFE